MLKPDQAEAVWNLAPSGDADQNSTNRGRVLGEGNEFQAKGLERVRMIREYYGSGPEM